MSMIKNNKKSCFIITPIGDVGSKIRREIDGIIDEVINPILEEMDYETNNVAHRKTNSNSITSDIIKNVYESDLCIANLTGCNANVMYELALRHASGKHVIIITDNISLLPFDVKGLRAIQYTNDIQGALELKENLKSSIEYIEKHPEEISNPIFDNLKKIIITDESIPKLNMNYKESLTKIINSIDDIKNSINISKDNQDDIPAYLKDILKNHDIKITKLKAQLNLYIKTHNIDNLNNSLLQLKEYNNKLNELCKQANNRVEDAVFNQMYQDGITLLNNSEKTLKISSQL
ncbi:MAG: hypothetical protein ACLSVX_13390 [Massilimicrobiota timonensis]